MSGTLRIELRDLRVRPHSRPGWLSAFCDGTIEVRQGDDVLFVDGPEQLPVELAQHLSRWLDGAHDGFAWFSSDEPEDDGPLLAWERGADGLLHLTSCFEHRPGAFTVDEARAAARTYIDELDAALKALGYELPLTRP